LEPEAGSVWDIKGKVEYCHAKARQLEES